MKKTVLLICNLTRDIWHKFSEAFEFLELRGQNYVNNMLPISHGAPDVYLTIQFSDMKIEFIRDVSICLNMSQSLRYSSQLAQISGNCLMVSKGVPL